jgi:hypothetical protein
MGSMRAAETSYKHFAQRLGTEFTQGHPFIDDVPIDAPDSADKNAK